MVFDEIYLKIQERKNNSRLVSICQISYYQLFYGHFYKNRNSVPHCQKNINKKEK